MELRVELMEAAVGAGSEGLVGVAVEDWESVEYALGSVSFVASWWLLALLRTFWSSAELSSL